jgi:hypothetical protein
MSLAAALILLFVVVPVIGSLLWLLWDNSFVRVDIGKLGLLIIKGRATDKVLQPGPHFTPALRRYMVQTYPSLELSYRAVDDRFEEFETGLECLGPRLRVTLGDRAVVDLSYTLRVRLVPEQLRSVHERFGADGIWSAIRDLSDRVIRSTVNDPKIGLDDLFGPARHALSAALASALSQRFAEAGFEMTLFNLGDADLGSIGDVVEDTLKSRFELEREAAEAAVRTAMARNDAKIKPPTGVDASDLALRYRENEVWRDLVHVLAGRAALVPPPRRSPNQNEVVAAPTPELPPSPDDTTGQDEP